MARVAFQVCTCYAAHVVAHAAHALICMCLCSGKNGKVKFTDDYADYVICVAGFHEHAHSAFAINEAYFEKYLAWCYDAVGWVALIVSMASQEINRNRMCGLTMCFLLC